jgi:ABC-type lipoprotein release transport system permease subunit
MPPAFEFPELGAMVFGISPFDLSTHTGALLVLSAGALSASLIPALRAAHRDPLLALRQD